jgi:hypothetical protein
MYEEYLGYAVTGNGASKVIRFFDDGRSAYF